MWQGLVHAQGWHTACSGGGARKNSWPSREGCPPAISLSPPRFGVEQRGRLLAKASPAPHVLHMTATPIPRTQALIDHGDMTQVGGRGRRSQGREGCTPSCGRLEGAQVCRVDYGPTGTRG